MGAPCLQAAVEQALPLDAAAERRARGHRVLEGFRELRDCVEKGEAKTLNQCLAESEKVRFYGWIELGVSSPIGIVYRTGFTIALVIHSFDSLLHVETRDIYQDWLSGYSITIAFRSLNPTRRGEFRSDAADV